MGGRGVTLVKVRDTCLLPHIVTRATSAHTSSWRTDCEEAVATATAPVAMEIAMCERSVSRTQTEGSGPNRVASHHSRDERTRWEQQPRRGEVLTEQRSASPETTCSVRRVYSCPPVVRSNAVALGTDVSRVHSQQNIWLS